MFPDQKPEIPLQLKILKLSLCMTKPKGSVCPVKTQIRLGIRPDCLGIHPHWSVFAARSVGSLRSKISSCGQRRLIRLGGCPSWSESSLVGHVILLVLLCSSSDVKFYNLVTGKWSINGLFVLFQTIFLSYGWARSEVNNVVSSMTQSNPQDFLLHFKNYTECLN